MRVEARNTTLMPKRWARPPMIRKAGISAKAETPAESAIDDGSAPSCWRRTERNVKPARMPTWMSPMASSARGNRGASARATPTEPKRAVEIGLASVLGSSGVERGRASWSAGSLLREVGAMARRSARSTSGTKTALPTTTRAASPNRMGIGAYPVWS